MRRVVKSLFGTGCASELEQHEDENRTKAVCVVWRVEEEPDELEERAESSHGAEWDENKERFHKRSKRRTDEDHPSTGCLKMPNRRGQSIEFCVAPRGRGGCQYLMGTVAVAGGAFGAGGGTRVFVGTRVLFGKACWRWSASCLACLDPEQLCGVCQLGSCFVGDSVGRVGGRALSHHQGKTFCLCFRVAQAPDRMRGVARGSRTRLCAVDKASNCQVCEANKRSLLN
ncbi:uncharacterized protein LOC109524004 [Hippocampus comes]|uniref:uncharacterized protein LOC109524004 n=1 Tax=Hippocampus comes TaxID=109280 RepID=UPI00094EA48D|nr:PREDICTED: uncharacterized protein LOC109524004 [Hippocampus comes]